MPATTITLGDTTVPRIGLGTNRLTATDANVAFVRAALDAGVAHIDTAHLYTSGESEQAIGRALTVPRDGCVVATKGGYRAGEGRPDVLRRQVDESLRRLATDVIDLYYLHRVHAETPLEESMRVLADAHEAGRIRHVGISEVGIDQVERARAVVPIAAVQNRYNLEDRGHDDVIDYCAEHGIAFVPYYPLHGREIPAVEQIAQRRGITTGQVALAWLLHRSPAVLPIPGTLSLDHLEENMAALQIELSGDELASLA